MSNYIERSMEAAFASDAAWGKFVGLIQDTVKATSLVAVCIGVSVSDVVHASDSSTGKGSAQAISTAVISDSVTSQRHTIALRQDNLNIRDYVRGGYGISFEDSIDVNDAVRVGLRIRTKELVRAQDQSISRRNTIASSLDRLKIADQAFRRVNASSVDTLHVLDEVKNRQQIRIQHEDILHISDESTAIGAMRPHIEERFKTSDQTWVQTHRLARSGDLVFIFDEQPRQQRKAQAWVANINRFAMSRYAPFDFDGFSVINEQLYAWNDEGVHLCNVEGELIQASIETGKLDFGESLVHPLAYFMEYSLSGQNKSIGLQIGTTQSGSLVHYNYALPSEQADYLTNGRVQFGRGLRGRHFSFKINMQGTAAELNSQSVDFSQTARRI